VSLTVSNTLAQQQAIQSQIAAAQSAPASSASSSDSTASTSSASASNPAAALISGNATLTSDLLSVLLNEQSNASQARGGSVTLAGIMDQQDATDQSQQQEQTGQPSLLNQLDTASFTQSASSTGSVMDGLQTLMNQLAV